MYICHLQGEKHKTDADVTTEGAVYEVTAATCIVTHDDQVAKVCSQNKLMIMNSKLKLNSNMANCSSITKKLELVSKLFGKHRSQLSPEIASQAAVLLESCVDGLGAVATNMGTLSALTDELELKLELTDELSRVRQSPVGVHEGFYCDGCAEEPIVGPRYTRLVEGGEVDLCTACFRARSSAEQPLFRVVQAQGGAARRSSGSDSDSDDGSAPAAPVPVPAPAPAAALDHSDARAVFAHFDWNHDGFLELGEMRALSQELYKEIEWDDMNWEPMCEAYKASPARGFDFKVTSSRLENTGGEGVLVHTCTNACKYYMKLSAVFTGTDFRLPDEVAQSQRRRRRGGGRRGRVLRDHGGRALHGAGGARAERGRPRARGGPVLRPRRGGARRASCEAYSYRRWHRGHGGGVCQGGRPCGRVALRH